MTADEILSKAQSVREFLKNGGITATGGEPLVQLDFLLELFKKAKENYSFHTCLDTSGICYLPSDERYIELIKYTDLVMLDIKHIDPEEHKKLTSMPQDNPIAFAKFLSDNNVPIWIRHVLVPGITQNNDYLYKLGRFIGGLKSLKAVDILPYHDMAKSKYAAMGIPYPLPYTPVATQEDVLKARETVLSGIKDTLNNKQ